VEPLESARASFYDNSTPDPRLHHGREFEGLLLRLKRGAIMEAILPMAGHNTRRLMIGRLRQIAVAVKNLETSKVFYRDTLGLKLLFEAPPGLAFFDVGGVWLMLSQENEKEPAQPGSVLYFEVQDIQESYEALLQRGMHFIDAPHRIADMGTFELWMAFFRDPDGTTLALRAEVAK
jgi:catechol 2,3-dioxygenase-like lactoylglutathione lyase family enzyme